MGNRAYCQGFCEDGINVNRLIRDTRMLDFSIYSVNKNNHIEDCLSGSSEEYLVLHDLDFLLLWAQLPPQRKELLERLITASPQWFQGTGSAALDPWLPLLLPLTDLLDFTNCEFTWILPELPSDGLRKTGHGDSILLSSDSRSWPSLKRNKPNHSQRRNCCIN